MTSDSRFRALQTDDHLEAAYAQSERRPVVLFKHSRTCSVSTGARRQMERLTNEDDPPVYELVVQQSRALSQHIGEALEIRHASPQAIVLSQRRPVAHFSHGRVTAEAVREAAKQAAPDASA